MVERHCRTNKSGSYQKKFNVCSDGFVRSTISYNVAKFDRLVQEGDDGRMRAVYDTVPETFGVDFSKNSNGYDPKKRKKCFFEEQVIYSRGISSETYEDRGYKHLYEKHHSCKKNRSQCKFCNSVICRAGKAAKRSVNFKKDDMFQVENEEVSCDNVSVNYSRLIQFYDERNKVGLKQKNDLFTTFIPPPLYDEGGKSRGVKVYVTEINADFCNDDISLLTIQVPVWVNYDVDGHQVRLDMPILSSVSDVTFDKIRFRWKRNCLLTSLKSIMNGYGQGHGFFGTMPFVCINLFNEK